jgi:hypothetical protein
MLKLNGGDAKVSAGEAERLFRQAGIRDEAEARPRPLQPAAKPVGQKAKEQRVPADASDIGVCEAETRLPHAGQEFRVRLQLDPIVPHRHNLTGRAQRDQVGL